MTILMPVCLACHDFRLWHTALRKGSRAGMPRADATTAKARAVVFRTYSSRLSMSGRMVAIMVASPAALARLLMISRPGEGKRDAGAAGEGVFFGGGAVGCGLKLRLYSLGSGFEF